AFVDLDTELAGPPGAGGRHPLPEARDFERAMRRAGVWNARPVVVHDAGNAMAAARAWWLLRYFGHETVFVLDGGYAAWLGGGRRRDVRRARGLILRLGGGRGPRGPGARAGRLPGGAVRRVVERVDQGSGAAGGGGSVAGGGPLPAWRRRGTRRGLTPVAGVR